MRSHAKLPNVVASESQIDSEGVTSAEKIISCGFSNQSVLLAMAQIALKNGKRDLIFVHTLLDQGSIRSFVSKRVVTALALDTTPTNINVKGVGDTMAATVKGFCNLTLASRFDEKFNCNFTALILAQLTSQLPPRKIPVADWLHLENLKLADPDYMKPKKLDCILGADAYAHIILSGIQTGPSASPMAQNTRLGWVIMGSACPANHDCLDTTTGL